MTYVVLSTRKFVSWQYGIIKRYGHKEYYEYIQGTKDNCREHAKKLKEKYPSISYKIIKVKSN